MEKSYRPKIIVCLPSDLTEMVNALPLFTHIKNHIPNAFITALFQNQKGSLLKGQPIDEILEFEKVPRFAPVLKNGEDVISYIQRNDYDIGITVPKSFSSAYLLYQGMVKKRIGFKSSFRCFMLTDVVKGDEYKNLLEPLEIYAEDWKPMIHSDKNDQNILQIGLHGLFNENSFDIKWDHQLIEYLIEELPSVEIVIFGTRDDKRHIERYDGKVSFVSTDGPLEEVIRRLKSLSVFASDEKEYIVLAESASVPVLNFADEAVESNWFVEDVFYKIKDAMLDALRSNSSTANLSEYDPIEKGMVIQRNLIKKNVGVIILAGGMGRRLGLNKPKGFLELGDKNLYDILLKKAAAAKKIGILTSPITFDQTKRYVEGKGIDLFKKKVYPTECGRGVSPEGNGALFQAVVFSEYWHEWKDLDMISVIAIDNPLADPLDEELLSSDKELAVIGVARDKMEEKLGVLCKKGSALAVREYFTLKKEGIEGLGYSGSFAARPSFFEKVAKEDLPFYRVEKKDEVFFERLLIDGFVFAEDFDVIEKDRKECFFPIKEKKDVFNYCKLQGIGGSR